MIIGNGGRVLVVDDEPQTLKACAATLKMKGIKDVLTEVDSRRVMERMAEEGADVVLLDLFMPHPSGMDLLPQLRERFPQVPVVVVSAAHELERAVECMKLGAFDYLVKPVENERLITALRKAFEWNALTSQIRDLREHLVEDRLNNPDVFSGIVTRDRRMRGLFQYVEVVAQSLQPILITGESGTGKELVARAIHRLSGCGGEMVSVNLAGLDDTMFSDTLFGHKRGAFTGAEQQRDGLIVKAAGSILFLDEIGDLVESSQVKLLRLLQEREFYPVGSDAVRKCDARIICASNRDIKGLVAAGRFRNDLYYRLCVHHVALPPLRERREDIPLLVDHFVREAALEMGIAPPVYPKELLELLAIYTFPGNVRELQGMVMDAVARCKSGMLSLEPFRQTISARRLDSIQTTTALPTDTDARMRTIEEIWGHFPTLNEAETFLIDAALDRAKGNQGIAATMLGLKRQTFNMRLKAKRKKD